MTSSRPRRSCTALLSVGVLALAATAGITGVGQSGASFTAQPTANRQSLQAASDWVRPVVAVADPGSPLRGAATFSATATDGGSGIAQVTIQRSPAASGTWTAVCVKSASPYQCPVDTTALADGSYDLRAVAVDVAGNSASSSTVGARVVDNTAPAVTITLPGTDLSGTIAIRAEAPDAGSGLASLVIQRAPAGTTTWTSICTTASSPATCSLNTATSATPDGSYDFRAVATDLAGNTATAVDADDLIDNTAPTVSVSVPGSPLRGVATLTSTPADPGASASGAASVTVQRAVAGSGQWQDVCTTTGSPWSCSWNSATVADGSSDFRAIARDLAGNSGTSATVTRTVDNTMSSITLTDPGAFLRGTVTLQAGVTAPGATPSVAMQLAVTGTTKWTTLCTVTVAPWSCAVDTTAYADGTYDLRAVLTDATGTKTSAVLATRTVDNTLLRGIDIQTQNKTGGTAGRIESGDAMTFTLSELLKPSTLVAGWTGASGQAIVMRVRDGSLIGGSGTDDTVEFFTDSTLKTTVALGAVNLKGDYVGSGRTSVLNATVTQATVGARTVVTVAVGSLVSGSVKTTSSRPAMVWTPSVAMTDLAGNRCSTIPVTETGSLDGDF